MTELARCSCGSLLQLRVSPSPFPGTEATISIGCPCCFAANRRSLFWVAVVTSEEEALS